MIQLPIIDCDEPLLMDDRPGQWLRRNGFRIYRTRVGLCRPFFRFPVECGKWPRTVPIARWIVGGYCTGMFAKHLNGNVLDCRRANLEPVRTRGEAGGCIPPGGDPLLLARPPRE